MEEQFPHPLPHATAHGAATGHPVSLIHVMHVTVSILHNEQFHNFPLLIAEITFYWCKFHEHVIVSIVPPQYSHLVTSGPYFNVILF